MSKNLRGLSERNGLISSFFKEISSKIEAESGFNDRSLKELSDGYHVGDSLTRVSGSFYDFQRKRIKGRDFSYAMALPVLHQENGIS